ncbi:MAG TPA: carboxy terminal-processing peptidase [Verrucomicrobiae bacterium]|nr:carboxy terminal-processing peptidase [Verrucomicrobiae bacterium]
MRLITVLFCWSLALAVRAADSVPDQTLITKNHTNLVRLAQGPNEASIARVTSMILQKGHYLRQKFDDEISSKFLDRYFDALDNLHIYFLQSDLKEFDVYRYSLDDLTLNQGDTTPGRVIFLRFLQRLQQQFDYVLELLKTEKFEFNTDERFTINRRTLPRPKDLDEAKKLWRERLRYEYLQEKLNKEKPDEIVKIITRRYTRILRALKEYDNDDVLEVYLTALAHVYDPHSDYLGKSALDNFSINMQLSLFGIGALLRSEDGFCKIQSLVPGGPAERGKKLKPNDKIIAVGQGDQAPVDTVDMKLNKVVEMIRGPEKTEVRLTIVPADASDPSVRKTISIIREKIKLEDQEAKAKIIELPAGTNQLMRLGVIDLPSFYSEFELEGRAKSGERKSTTVDVSKLLHKLVQEHVGGIILDLRRNGGGSLEEAINLTGLFIKEGPVVQIKDSDGRINIDKDPDPAVLYDGPLIVLTSRFSASASEILAGALQDYGRALIVGDTSTHGKGTVQSLIQLAPHMRQFGLGTTNDPGAVKITIRKFYRASGSSTQLKGVVPDIVLPSVNNTLEVGETSLDNPLPWDTIDPAPDFDKLKVNRVEPYLTELKYRSDKRVAVDRDFAFLREEIERFKKAVAEKSVSMNEAKRWKEKNEADARSKARKKDLASRPEPPGKVYEITLKNVAEPGLPPPMAKTNQLSKAETSPDKTEKKLKLTANKRDPKEAPVVEAPTDEDEEAADNGALNVDITMDETKRILSDYINLSMRNPSLAGPVGASTAQTAK